MRSLLKVNIFFLLLCIMSATLLMSLQQKPKPKKKVQVYHSMVERIKNNDTLYIHFSTEGCFHYYTELMKIYRKGEGLMAELSTTIPDKPPYPSLKQTMHQTAIQAYAKFEKQGRTLVTQGGCTTQEAYVIALKGDTLRFEDQACQFEGYSEMKTKVFGEEVMKKNYKGDFGIQ